MVLAPARVTGLVADVQRFRVDAGPGVRTAVVLKGCPMRCVWCENTHLQQPRPQYRLEPEACRACAEDPACGLFEPAAPTSAPLADCGRCVRCEKICAHDLLKPIGQTWTLSRLLESLERDARLFEGTGGGVTVTGGEPLYQFEFSTALLAESRRRGWHTALATSGQCSTSVFEEALVHCDLVLFDLKETDLDLHWEWTGVALEPIIRNLVRAAVSPAELWVRLPVVPLTNDRDDHWEQVGHLLADLPGPPAVQLMPCRYDGHVRLRDLPQSTPLEPSEDRLAEIAGRLRRHGLEVM